MAQEEGLESPRKNVVKVPSPRAVYALGLLLGVFFDQCSG
jgi:hypothetical protein